ncbi:MAG: NADH-quinone oxidoreductase subunit NuoK [Cyclobacteriaceae bacterium]
MSELDTTYYLYLSALLFSAGLFVVISKRNVVFVLIGIELILNGANLLLATFSRINLNGQIFAIFSIVLTVCEVAIALAILLNIYRRYNTSNLDELQEIGNE